jgi:hypothetical protein
VPSTNKGLTTGKTAVSIGYALKRVRITSDATGVCTEFPCAFPGAFWLELDGTGSYAPARKEYADPTFTHRSGPHFFLCTWRAYKKPSTWRTKERVFRYSDLRLLCLSEMQPLAQQCTKRVLFSTDKLELEIELLVDARGGRIASGLEADIASPLANTPSATPRWTDGHKPSRFLGSHERSQSGDAAQRKRARFRALFWFFAGRNK